MEEAQPAEKPRVKWSPPPKDSQPISELEQGLMLAFWSLRHKVKDFTVLVPDADKEKFQKTLAYWGQDPQIQVLRVPTGTKGGKFSRRDRDGKMVEIDNPVVEIKPHSTVIQMVDRATGVHITPGTPEDGPELWNRKELDNCMEMVEPLIRGGAMQAGQRIYSSGETADMVRCLLVMRDYIRGLG